MGAYDTYGSGIQIKAGECMMRHYEVGDACDLEDGIYLDYAGAIVVFDRKFIAEFPHIFTKYGGTIDSNEIINKHNPVSQTVNAIVNAPQTITIKRCAACGQDHENIKIEGYLMSLVYIDGKQITHWTTCPKTDRTINIAIDKDNKERCTNYL